MNFELGDRVIDGYGVTGEVTHRFPDSGEYDFPVVITWDIPHYYWWGEHSNSYTAKGSRYTWYSTNEKQLIKVFKSASMERRIETLCDLLDKEQQRVKQFLNENGLDCTSAAFPIVKRYREELKEYIKVLRANIED